METKRSAVMTVIRVTSGNFLEMLDFFLFGLFAAPIGKAFFPIEDDVGRLLLTFVTFGAGFLMRPLGALVLGAYIDRVGRRKGLVTTLAIMALGTVLIAMTPGYRWFQSISPSLIYVAPAIVLVGRLAQGFSAGVELGGVSVYLSEIATPGHKGFYASWQSGSQQVAVMVGALLVFFVNKSMPAAQVESWGWRIPFFIGCIIVPLIFVIRRNLQETESFLKQKRHPTGSEIIRTVLSNSRIVILGMLLVVMTTVSFYLITIYTPTFGKQTLKLASTDALVVTFAVGLSNFFWLPVMGALSDAIGRKPLLLTFTALAVLTVYPAMLWLVDGPTFTKMLIVELWLSFLYASYNGALVVALTEIVPPSVRTSGFSLAYSLATAIFGGFTPAISEWLIGFTADKAAPGLWMSAAAAISFVAAVLVFRSKPVYVEEQGHALAAH